MSDSHRRINKGSENLQPMLDFVEPQSRFRLQTVLMLSAVLLMGVFVFQQYRPWLQKTADTVAYEWRIDTPLAENANHVVAALRTPEVAVETVTAEEGNQDQLATENKADDLITVVHLPARRSPRVITPVARKSANYAGAGRAALPEKKTVDAGIDAGTGSVAPSEKLAQRREPQQQIVIPEVAFNRHGRLMESTYE